MKLTMTPYGHKAIVSQDTDEALFEDLAEMISELSSANDDPDWIEEQNNKVGQMVMAFYMNDLGYLVTEQFESCMNPRFKTLTPTSIEVDIPDPALTYMFGADKAYALLDEICLSGKFDTLECDSSTIASFYEDPPQFEDLEDIDDEDEDNDDEEDDIVEDEDNSSEDPESQTADASNSSPIANSDDNKAASATRNFAGGIISIENEASSDGTNKTLYRLPKGADMFRYRRMANMFYVTPKGQFFMELKKNVPCLTDGLSKQTVDIRFAKAIQPDKLN